MAAIRIMALDARNYCSLMQQRGVKELQDLATYTDEDLKACFKMRKQHRQKILQHVRSLTDLSLSLSPRHQVKPNKRKLKALASPRGRGDVGH